MVDYYRLLGVGRRARARPRSARPTCSLAKERHPDRFTDPTEKEKAQSFFQDLTTAFNTLFNENRRREYDEERERQKPTSPGGDRPGRLRAAAALPGAGGLPRRRSPSSQAAVHHAAERRALPRGPRPLPGRKRTTAREAHPEPREGDASSRPGTRRFYADLALLSTARACGCAPRRRSRPRSASPPATRGSEARRRLG